MLEYEVRGWKEGLGGEGNRKEHRGRFRKGSGGWGMRGLMEVGVRR